MRSLALVLCMIGFLAADRGLAQITDYGPFRHSPALPNVLVMTGDITPVTAHVLRRALDEQPQVDTLFLASPGGNVLVGLELSGIVQDRGLNTVVPPRADCASACSFLFVAGKKRRVYGRLGVHQFSSGGRVQGARAEGEAQTLMAQILATLGAYNVPQHFIVKMLETPHTAIYWFTTEELRSHGIETFATFPRELETFETIPELAARAPIGGAQAAVPQTVTITPAPIDPVPEAEPEIEPAPAPEPVLAPQVSRPAMPSFDCSKAQTVTERYLCSDAEVADLDRLMAQRFRAARDARSFAQEQALINAQRAWLRRRDRCGDNKSCLTELYAQRIRELAQ